MGTRPDFAHDETWPRLDRLRRAMNAELARCQVQRREIISAELVSGWASQLQLLIEEEAGQQEALRDRAREWAEDARQERLQEEAERYGDE